jgi:hypothetical protein
MAIDGDRAYQSVGQPPPHGTLLHSTDKERRRQHDQEQGQGIGASLLLIGTKKVLIARRPAAIEPIRIPNSRRFSAKGKYAARTPNTTQGSLSQISESAASCQKWSNM